MTVAEIAEKLELKVLVEPAAPETAVTDCYIGDLLSWVMGRAPGGSVWVTVMGNVNAIAVARLADAAMIVLCENAPLDTEAAAQAERNGIAVYQSGLSSYRLALAVAKLLGH